MSEEAKQSVETLGTALDELTYQCWKIVSELCGKNLPLLVAVTTQMNEIAMANQRYTNITIIGDSRLIKQTEQSELNEKAD